MTLEHYPAMTEKALAGIAAEAERRWPIIDGTIIHRVGRLEPGARIVLVAVSSSHRAAALEACAFLLDWLQPKALLWKLEELADGGRRWVDARPEDDAAAERCDVTRVRPPSPPPPSAAPLGLLPRPPPPF